LDCKIFCFTFAIDMKFDNTKFSKAVREKRGRLSLAEFSVETGVGKDILFRVEKGAIPSVPALCKILVYADWDFKQFLTDK